MSRTYKYPREALEDSISGSDIHEALTIRQKLERRKLQIKRKIKMAHSLKKFVRFRNRTRV